jgi:hypothetical protein
MPRGPKGEKRPADVIGAAIMVGRIATARTIATHWRCISFGTTGRANTKRTPVTRDGRRADRQALVADRSREHH